MPQLPSCVSQFGVLCGTRLRVSPSTFAHCNLNHADLQRCKLSNSNFVSSHLSKHGSMPPIFDMECLRTPTSDLHLFSDLTPRQVRILQPAPRQLPTSGPSMGRPPRRQFSPLDSKAAVSSAVKSMRKLSKPAAGEAKRWIGGSIKVLSGRKQPSKPHDGTRVSI